MKSFVYPGKLVKKKHVDRLYWQQIICQLIFFARLIEAAVCA